MVEHLLYHLFTRCSGCYTALKFIWLRIIDTYKRPCVVQSARKCKDSRWAPDYGSAKKSDVQAEGDLNVAIIAASQTMQVEGDLH